MVSGCKGQCKPVMQVLLGKLCAMGSHLKHGSSIDLSKQGTKENAVSLIISCEASRQHKCSPKKTLGVALTLPGVGASSCGHRTGAQAPLQCFTQACCSKSGKAPDPQAWLSMEGADGLTV